MQFMHPGHLRCCGQTYSRVLNGDVGGPLRSWINDTSLQQQEVDKEQIDHPSPHVLEAKEWISSISKYLQDHNPLARALMSMGEDPSVNAVKFMFTFQSQHMEQERLNCQELALVYLLQKRLRHPWAMKISIKPFPLWSDDLNKYTLKPYNILQVQKETKHNNQRSKATTCHRTVSGGTVERIPT
jgi:hypothetical protein